MGTCLRWKNRKTGITEVRTCPSSKDLQATIRQLLAVVLLFNTGCQSGTRPLPKELLDQSPGLTMAGDVLKISFTGAPELNQSQRIGSDGKLSLPSVGEVDAAGKSLSQLQRELTSLYKSQLQNNEVVVVLESRATPVVVAGAVQKPGKVIFERPATVLEAIMEAGGFSPTANPGRVSLIRIVKGQHFTRMFDLRPVLRGATTEAVYVRGNDVIYVPESLF